MRPPDGTQLSSNVLQKIMVMWLVIAILGIILLYIIFAHFGSKPLYYRGVKPSGFKRYIDNLLLRGEPGSFVIIEHEGSERFLQLALQAVDENVLTFEMGFPKVSWSSPYYESAARAANELGIDVIGEPGVKGGPVTGFLRMSKKGSYPAVL